MVIAFAVTWVSLRFSRGALGACQRRWQPSDSSTATAESAGPSLKWIGNALAHGYIWFWLAIFALPFVATTSTRSIAGWRWSFNAYQYVLGTFKDNLMLSFKRRSLTIVINLLLSVPAAYAIVRYPFPGKSFLLSILNLSLYTPAAVMGLSLVITYAFLFHIPRTVTGLVAAYVVGTYPLMLVPIIVALRDLPTVYEEAARTLGATRIQTFCRIEIAAAGTRDQRRDPADIRDHLQRVPGHAVHCGSQHDRQRRFVSMT